MKLLVLFILITLHHVTSFTPRSRELCHWRNFRHVRGQEDNDYLLYGLTQDCQMFFIRPSQLSLLSTLNVNTHSSYCYPNLVQLHVQSEDSLLLMFKQAGNRICTLNIQIPSSDLLFGDHLFSYHLLASLSYAACSHTPPNGFSLETDLSYLDSIFKDIIYFVDGLSQGSMWTVHQFQVTEHGHLRYLQKLTVNNHSKRKWTGPDIANEYVLGLDTQRNYLFKRNRFESNFVYECAFDLMFRPNNVSVHYGNSSEAHHKTWLNSIAADKNLLIYVETDRTVTPSVTNVYGRNISTTDDAYCLTTLPFAVDMGIVRTRTLKNLTENPLPPYDQTKRVTQPSTSSPLRTTTLRHRKTTLKATPLHATTEDSVMTSTRLEQTTTTEEYEEEDEDEDEEVDETPKVLPTEDVHKNRVNDVIDQNMTLNSDSVNMNSTSSCLSIGLSMVIVSVIYW